MSSFFTNSKNLITSASIYVFLLYATMFNLSYAGNLISKSNDPVIYTFMDIVSTYKENGRHFLISGFEANETKYIVFGSKHNYYVCPVESIIEYAPLGEVAYSTPLLKERLDTFKNIFLGLSEIQKKMVVEFLNPGKSLIGEYSDGMHIISPREKERPTIKFSGITSSTSNYNKEDCEFDNSNSILEKINELDLPVVSSEKFPYSELDNKNKAVSTMTDFKDYIDHFFTGEQWIGSSKHKMYWYVLLRELREEIVKGVNRKAILDEDEIKKLVEKKGKFLHMSDDIKTDLTNKLIDFSNELKKKIFKPECFNYSEIDFQEGIDNMYKKTIIHPKKHDEKGTVIFFNGLSGMGKDTVGEAMETLDGRFIRLSQDQFLDLENNDEKSRLWNAKQLCLSYAIEEIKKGFIPVICRNNQTKEEFWNFKCQFRGLADCLLVTASELWSDKSDEFSNICRKSIADRNNHILSRLSKDKINAIHACQIINLGQNPPDHAFASILYVDFLNENMERKAPQVIASQILAYALDKTQWKKPEYKKDIAYMHLPTNQEFISAVDSEIATQNDKSGPKLAEYKDHVTLMYMADLWLPNSRNKWFSIKKHINQGELTVRSDRYLINEQGETVLLCNIIDKDENDVSDQYVYSGEPHITWSLDHVRQPVSSLKIIKDFKEGIGNFKEVYFKDAIEFSADIATKEKRGPTKVRIREDKDVYNHNKDKKKNKGKRKNRGKKGH